MGRRLCAARAAIGRGVWERPRRPGPRRQPAARAYIGAGARASTGRARSAPCFLASSPLPAPGMAPSTVAVELLSPKEKNRLRKPVVEKMRRDRINSSIEQLKLLLEQEFARHQPNSKLEKADILEMAVSYLKHSKAFAAAAAGPKSLHQDYSEGYSWCLQEAVQFLTLHAASDTQMKLLYHFQRPPAAPAAPAKEPKAPGSAPAPAPAKAAAAASARQPACGLWRPW
ncbi:transcription factor HES-5 isoform X2 [Tursiops truncatus]|uniref:Transcription factor HES-5 n=3 Tax=Odontoceti TaxID=9722 RepID=A0A2U4B7J7_TURTR|nr:transcription factor HES-5 isoform X2 [Tursiops truncatus]XP_030736740.1 transcription factor HES-5 isoform X3 [Globicephala melas]